LNDGAFQLPRLPQPMAQQTSENETKNTPREKREVVRGMFNRIAPTYDLLNRILSFGIDRRWRRSTIQLMGLDERSVVLDLACGTGDLSDAAAKQGARVVFAVDPSREMLLRAGGKLRFTPARCYFVEAFGEELPLKSELCTHAMIAFGIRNVQERHRAFAEIYRILKPGGVFAVLEFTPMDRKFISSVFNLYFQKLLPAIGGLISRDRQAYQYLPESVARFVTTADLMREGEQAGFEVLGTKVYAMGVATCILFRKPD
jgi:demethylmenaquinone methyltransferase / 2-methoxy-6-polyprenyl-1,4-benzoquinol methylase